jgi:hypothetical protein
MNASAMSAGMKRIEARKNPASSVRNPAKSAASAERVSASVSAYTATMPRPATTARALPVAPSVGSRPSSAA